MAVRQPNAHTESLVAMGESGLCCDVVVLWGVWDLARNQFPIRESLQWSWAQSWGLDGTGSR